MDKGVGLASHITIMRSTRYTYEEAQEIQYLLDTMRLHAEDVDAMIELVAYLYAMERIEVPFRKNPKRFMLLAISNLEILYSLLRFNSIRLEDRIAGYDVDVYIRDNILCGVDIEVTDRATGELLGAVVEYSLPDQLEAIYRMY